jgi:hypothetical protein
MRTQNPPPLKACRFDSDLGHQSYVFHRHSRPHHVSRECARWLFSRTISPAQLPLVIWLATD